MAKRITDYVRETLTKPNEKGEFVRFSVAITPSSSRRLEYILNQLSGTVSKSGFAGDAINLLLAEFEEQLGLLVRDEEGKETWTDDYMQKVMFPSEDDFYKETGIRVKYGKEGAK